jgi:hypothetical protein
MLYIKDNEKLALPKKYHNLNNISAIIYDQLAEIFVSKNYKKLKEGTFKLDKKNYLFFDELKNGEINFLDWFKANNLTDELTSVLTLHITMSVVSDFVNFIYESLSNAKRGKMTVAYALLRKPLTDELLILEQLLYDPHEFIQRFYHSGEPTDYDPSKNSIDKKTIIRNALTKAKPNLIFTEGLIYELRYDKTSKIGLNGISNHALHIVTNDKHYKTAKQNLNFVFSNDDDATKYWNHYYHFVPYLLTYSVSIIDNIIFNFLPDKGNQNLKAIKSFKRLIGLILWSEQTEASMKKENKKLFDAIALSTKLDCENCKIQVDFSKADFILFFEAEILLCPKCFSNLLSTPKSIKKIRELVNKLSSTNPI